MKAKYLMLNGEFHASDSPCIRAGNRGLLYGEAAWVSMRANSSKAFFFTDYYESLINELQQKELQIPSMFQAKIVEHDIYLLLQKSRIYRGAIVRITLFRNENDTFFYNSDTPVSVLIEAEAYPDQTYTLNTAGLKMAVFEQKIYPSQKPSYSPSLQGLGFTGMANHLSHYQVDNFYLINDQNNIFQSPGANVMFIKDNSLIMPSDQSLYTKDVLCDITEEAARLLGMEIIDNAQIKPRDLSYFDEAILIDSIHGIRWVQAFGEKRFYNRIAAKLIESLVQIQLSN